MDSKLKTGTRVKSALKKLDSKTVVKSKKDVAQKSSENAGDNTTQEAEQLAEKLAEQEAKETFLANGYLDLEVEVKATFGEAPRLDSDSLYNSDMAPHADEPGMRDDFVDTFGPEPGLEIEPSVSITKVRSRRRKKPTGPSAVRKRTQASVHPDNLIELKAQGISLASALGRPVLILRNEDQTALDAGDVLPIWMQSLDATLAIAELSHASAATPHSPMRALLNRLQVRVYSCVFEELVGHHQYADLVFQDASELNRPDCEGRLRVRADEAMSFCLQVGAKFFARRSFMKKSRDLDMDLAKLEHNLGEGLLPELREELENSSRKHPYVM